MDAWSILQALALFAFVGMGLFAAAFVLFDRSLDDR